MQGGRLLVDTVREDLNGVTLGVTDARYDINITITIYTPHKTVTMSGHVKDEASQSHWDNHTYIFSPSPKEYSTDSNGTIRIPITMGELPSDVRELRRHNWDWFLDEFGEVYSRNIGVYVFGTLTIESTSIDTCTFEFKPPGKSGTVTRNLKITEKTSLR